MLLYIGKQLLAISLFCVATLLLLFGQHCSQCHEYRCPMQQCKQTPSALVFVMSFVSAAFLLYRECKQHDMHACMLSISDAGSLPMCSLAE